MKSEKKYQGNNKSALKKTGLAALTIVGIPVVAGASAFATEQNTTFQVNVAESLTVSVTAPSESATGDINEFLRNKISLNVTTNADNGFTASMTMQGTETGLKHIMDLGSIPTLASSVSKSSFPVNYWGYSLDDTDAGNNSSTYGALVSANATPISLITNAQSATISSRDIFFGTKADASKPSGTYSGTVLISVVTGAIEEDPSDPGYNPTTPTNPAAPGSTENTPQYSGAGTNTGNTTNGATTYTYSRSGGTGSSATTTTTTEVSAGDNRDAYVGYTPPQGVTDRSTTTSNVSEGNSLAAGLALTAAATATSGFLFFILAKRKKDEEEEEEEQQ